MASTIVTEELLTLFLIPSARLPRTHSRRCFWREDDDGASGTHFFGPRFARAAPGPGVVRVRCGKQDVNRDGVAPSAPIMVFDLLRPACSSEAERRAGEKR